MKNSDDFYKWRPVAKTKSVESPLTLYINKMRTNLSIFDADDNYVMQLKVQQRFCLPQDQLFFYNTRSEMDVIIALHVAENGFHYKNGATPKYKGSLFRLACCIL